ncbi:MAG: amino acid ABC transporter ATP-binding protein [Phycisphaerales bacterium]|nr:amino acid ABC transporter ATP-binding protein [Phycisphaerales bacterium]
MTAISARNLSKRFGHVVAVNDVTFEVEPRELLAIVGPSGCGKSTLLRCLNGLEMFDAGGVNVGDAGVSRAAISGHRAFERAVHPLRQRTGMVFQGFNLFGHLTVLQNVMLALRVVKKMPLRQAEQVAHEQLARVGLGDRAGYRPQQLSGGQQQRAAIARALATNPSVMLYDEPTSALDPTLVREVLLTMRRLHDEGVTQLIVTHEMRFAREAADRIMLLDAGKIAALMPTAEFFSHRGNAHIEKFLEPFRGVA